MVVGMQNSQQQPHASPATVLEDATTPCALLPSSSLASSLHINKTDCVNSDEHSSTSDESKELAKMAATIKPDAISVAPSNRVKLKDVNEYLICILCNGYFVDATSIAECLHSCFYDDGTRRTSFYFIFLVTYKRKKRISLTDYVRFS
ncbi:hypothetical protein PGB90_000161 [Kerria lacca]